MNVIGYIDTGTFSQYQIKQGGIDYDLSADGVIRVEVVSGNVSIDSDSDAISFTGAVLSIKWGALVLAPGVYAMTVNAYKAGSPTGDELFGPGTNPIYLTVVDGNSVSKRFITAVDITDRNPKWSEAKDPADIEPYPVDASKWAIGEYITSASFIPPLDSELVVGEPDIKGQEATPTISGGVIGNHLIDVTLTSNTGRAIQRHIRLRVLER